MRSAKKWDAAGWRQDDAAMTCKTEKESEQREIMGQDAPWCGELRMQAHQRPSSELRSPSSLNVFSPRFLLLLAWRPRIHARLAATLNGIQLRTDHSDDSTSTLGASRKRNFDDVERGPSEAECVLSVAQQAFLTLSRGWESSGARRSTHANELGIERMNRLPTGCAGRFRRRSQPHFCRDAVCEGINLHTKLKVHSVGIYCLFDLAVSHVDTITSC